MNTFHLSLDLDKSRWSPDNLVTIRQGDKSGTTLVATIFDHGEQVSTAGLNARVVIPLPDHEHYYRQTATYAAGVCTVEIDETQAASVAGTVDNAYFQLLEGSSVIASTQCFTVHILPDALQDMELAEDYDSAIQEALDELDEATGRIAILVQEETDAWLASHPEITTTVQDNSVTDAKLIQSGGILDRVARLWHRLDNLLTNTPAEADSASVSDAARTPLAGLSIYGRSTQSGTPTPSSPVPIQSITPNLYGFTDAPARTSNGVTWTPQADGSIRAEGTATNTSYALGSSTTADFGKSYFVHLKKGGTYTATSFGRLQFNVFVMKPDGTTSTIAGYSVDDKTFTVADECYVQLGPRVSSGTVTNTTYHIVLVEGSTASGAPIPYQNVGLWARGRNLLDAVSAFDKSTTTYGGCTITRNGDGTFALSGTNNLNGSWIFHSNSGRAHFLAGTYTFSDGGSPLVGCYMGIVTSIGTFNTTYGTVTFTAAEPFMVYEWQVSVQASATISGTACPTLTLGSASQQWTPYGSVTIPIPLQGHELRSLPDGTRDEVTVDAYGHAVLVQRVGSVTFDGSSDEGWTAYTVQSKWHMGTSAIQSLVEKPSSNNVQVPMCCSQIEPKTASYVLGPNEGIAVPTSGVLTCFLESYQTASAWREHLAESPMTLLYKLATPVTIDLGTIDPVALQGPDMTAQSVPTAPFALTYERDLNITLARLEAAIADAATA